MAISGVVPEACVLCGSYVLIHAAIGPIANDKLVKDLRRHHLNISGIGMYVPEWLGLQCTEDQCPPAWMNTPATIKGPRS